MTKAERDELGKTLKARARRNCRAGARGTGVHGPAPAPARRARRGGARAGGSAGLEGADGGISLHAGVKRNGPGRPCIGARPMTSTERVQRYRDRLRQGAALWAVRRRIVAALLRRAGGVNS